MAVHKSLTTQNSLETISHKHFAGKAHLIMLRRKPPGSDCLTMWEVYLPSNDIQKREQLYQVIQNGMKYEADKAAGRPQPYDIIAGDMIAVLLIGIVQKAELGGKDIRHQHFVKTPCLHTTEFDRQVHTLYNFCHRPDGSQNSRIDDTFISKSMGTAVLPSIEINEHIRRCRPCTSPGQTASCMKSLKSGPDPILLPPKARLPTPVPEEDQKEPNNLLNR